MHTDDHRFVAVVIAIVAVTGAAWLLLFVGPHLLNAHRDDAAMLALLLYLGVPSGLAWGGIRLGRLFDPKDHDNELY